MLEATVWSNPVPDPRLKLRERKGHPRRSWPLPREDKTNHITSQAPGNVNSTSDAQYAVRQRNAAFVCRIYSLSIQAICIVSLRQYGRPLCPQPAYPVLLLAITSLDNKSLAVLIYPQHLSPPSPPLPGLCGITSCYSPAVITITPSFRIALAHPAPLTWPLVDNFSVLTS